MERVECERDFDGWNAKTVYERGCRVGIELNRKLFYKLFDFWKKYTHKNKKDKSGAADFLCGGFLY